MNGAELLERLVGIPSPTGREDAVVDFLRRQARADGFTVLDDPVGNFVAEAGRGPRLLLFVGHVDTVPGDIAVRRENGTLWGRGTVDAKGPLAAAYTAARRFLRDERIRIRVVGAVDEEGRSRGAKAVPVNLDPAWILIGEPSGVQGLTLGYKGILRGTFHVLRERSHGAHPRPSAAEDALSFWRALDEGYRFANHFEALSGRLDSLQTASDGLRDHVEGRFSLRLPPGIEPARIAEELLQQGELRHVKVEIEESVRGAQASKRNLLVAAFLSAIRETGASPRIKRKTGTSDFNLFAERHPGVPIAAYGPGDAALDHTPHEHIEIREFEGSVEVLGRVFETLAGGGQRRPSETFLFNADS